MGLLGNYNVLLKSCGNFSSGTTVSEVRANYNTANKSRNYYLGAFDKLCAIPNGYYMPNSFVMPITEGGVSISDEIGFLTGITLDLAGGVNGEADIILSLNISNADAGLIVAAAASLLASFTTSAMVIGKLQAAAALSISTSVVAGVRALGLAIAEMNGSVNVISGTAATGNVSANITSVTELSPENLAAAVWSSLAAVFNDPGTMGYIMNNIGASSNPWDVVLEGGYTAGELMRVLTAIAAGKTTIVDLGGGAATVTFRNLADTVDQVKATMAGSERAAINLDVSD